VENVKSERPPPVAKKKKRGPGDGLLPRVVVTFHKHRERFDHMKVIALEDGLDLPGWIRMTLFKAMDERDREQKRRMKTENASPSFVPHVLVPRHDRNDSTGHIPG
jgi:hypothetical protein